MILPVLGSMMMISRPTALAMCSRSWLSNMMPLAPWTGAPFASTLPPGGGGPLAPAAGVRDTAKMINTVIRAMTVNLAENILETRLYLLVWLVTCEGLARHPSTERENATS